MNLTSSAETITCARPGCGAATTLADSVYVDGCGQICPGCDEALFGPCPPWWNDDRAPLLGRGSASLGACGHPVSARVEHVSRARRVRERRRMMHLA